MIKVEDLHKSFDGVEVIKGINLSVDKGEIIALIGGSGHGKSVLLKQMAGLLKPDRGHILIDGLEIGRIKGRALSHLRSRMGFLFQGGALFDSMTVLDNVAFPLREKTRLKEAEIKEKVFHVLEMVGLSEAEGKFPSQLSGGMIKRAALARELVWNPEIMFFDEPTTGLDPIIGHSILKLIDNLHRTYGFTGIIVTHEIPRVFDIVDRVAMLYEGVILISGPPEEVRNSEDPIVRQFVRGETEGPVTYG
ncbi:MAG: ABC transporter ATP-binding protein [Deltaproteobacteria bacterium]|nr:ABC transporter ATP-binding protein [Deltaproteobacteria bacterium]